MTKKKAYHILQLLEEHYPDAKMILQWENNFELLVSIILSAQCTDAMVNKVTTKVFPKYRKRREELNEKYEEYRNGISSYLSNVKGDPHVVRQRQTPQDGKLDWTMIVQLANFAFVPLQELEEDIKSTGFYHNKAKNVQGAARVVLDVFHGILPPSIEELVTIPGVGRKTANVFLGNAYGIYEGIAVDTHVTKQSQVLGFTTEKTPEKIEKDLMQLFDKKDWFRLTYLLIEHGRNMRKKKSDRHMCGKSTCLLCKHA